VLAEAAMMVPDVRLRLENALGDLVTAVVRRDTRAQKPMAKQRTSP
jgi:hypothetical protein